MTKRYPAPARPMALWRYGVPGLPLALVALPLYVHLPHHYAALGASLATLGAVLLLARVFDAITDPLLGRWIDGIFRRGPQAVLWHARWVALTLALGMVALWFPPTTGWSLGPWALLCLVPVTLAYSALVIAHQSWGARLGGDDPRQARIVAWREGWALVGVVLAAVLPSVAGWPTTLAAWCAALALALWAWGSGPRPLPQGTASASSIPASSRAVSDTTPTHDAAPSRAYPAADRSHASSAPRHPLWHPWRQARFRQLISIFVVSGLASAVPATLVLFFIDDRLQTPNWQPVYLGSYFVAAAAGMPLWLALARRWGLAHAWLAGMFLSVAVFAWAATLQAGDAFAFWVICALSGAALGADLALPAALLAGVIGDAGDRGQHEGTYFGWWNVAAKANLALAAGLVLPGLQVLGYQPGARDAAALQALTLAYAVLPCILKLGAAALLWRWLRLSRQPVMPSASATVPAAPPPADRPLSSPPIAGACHDHPPT